jgi:hypothetical protein
MIRPKAEQLWLAAGFLLTPLPALAQMVHPEESLSERVSDHAPGFALCIIALAVIGVVYVALRDKFRRDLFVRFIDKGQEVPAALLPAPPSRLRELRRGVWLTCLGLGIGVVLYIMSGSLRVAAWSLIPLFLGAASFLNAALFYPNPDSRP